MVKGIVEKTLKKALIKFATEKDTKANSIAFYIHTKNDEYNPEYFYSVNGQVVVGENGSPTSLRFTQDILGLKMDLQGREMISSQFLSRYFKTLSEITYADLLNELSEEKKAFTTEEALTKIDVKNLYIMVTSADEEAKKLRMAIYNKNHLINEMKLEHIFGDED
tara:strand:- start:268 stop:762 length:495 start_codon:yes stop_codon:yes gene_type:complete